MGHSSFRAKAPVLKQQSLRPISWDPPSPLLSSAARMALPPSVIAYQQQHISDNKQPGLIAVSVICLTLACFAVGLRVISRRKARNPLGPDDYTIFLALVFTAIFVAMVLVCTRFGLGRHLILVTDGTSFGKVCICSRLRSHCPVSEQITNSTQSLLATEILYNPAIFTTKLSILFLYRRIFPVRKFVVVLWLVGAFVAAYSLTASLVNLLQCLPVNAMWNPRVKPKCVNLGVELIVVSSINVVTDFIILCLPIPLVWRLQTSLTSKVQVTGMFFLGSL